MKKTILTLATATVLSVAALAPTATPASASRISFGLGLYPECYTEWREVDTYYGPVWKKVRICPGDAFFLSIGRGHRHGHHHRHHHH
jgi:hypothetical protein